MARGNMPLRTRDNRKRLANPSREGQPALYLRAQLLAFASGGRRNDIGEQMRNIARRMTPEEIDAASRFYSDRP